MDQNPFAPETERPNDDDVRPPQPDGMEPAWERRGQLGFGAALLQTFSAVLFHPSATFRRFNTAPQYAAPILFVIIPGFFSFLLSSMMQQIQASFLSTLFGIEPSAGLPLSLLIIWLPAIIFALFFKAMLYHLALTLFRGNRVGFAGTFRVVAYTAGSMALFTWIPCLGALISLSWGTYLEVVGLKHVHQTSGGRAALAVLVPVVFLVIACAIVIVAVFLPGLLGGLSNPASVTEI